MIHLNVLTRFNQKIKVKIFDQFYNQNILLNIVIDLLPLPNIANYKQFFHNLGKVIWLSGPPGAGKSTTAQLMGRDAGYVYYEADCALNFLNPFVPSDVDNPTIAAFRQKPLKVLDSQRSQILFLIRLFRGFKKLLCFSGYT